MLLLKDFGWLANIAAGAPPKNPRSAPDPEVCI